MISKQQISFFLFNFLIEKMTSVLLEIEYD